MQISDFTSVQYDFIFENLSDEEGVRHTSYRDTNGILTVGIGHNLQEESIDHIIGHTFLGSLTDNEISLVFKQDLLRTLKSISDNLTPSLKSFPDNVQYVIISLTFNLGWAGFSKFILFQKALKNHDYWTCADELKKSKWWNQVGKRGPKLANLLSDAIAQ